jgi:tRNA A-37 threonylcarbamoyl transferase component Bud32
MPISSEGNKPVSSIGNSICGELDKIINRPEKGLVMKFFSDRVIKDYSAQPKHPDISREEQTRRLIAEVSAYRRFEELDCPFVPKLLEASIEQRRFAISLVQGDNLLELFQTNQCRFSMRHIIHQIDEMNCWLGVHGFGNLGNKIKDFVLEPAGKLYLVDFETYSPDSRNTKTIDIYETIIYDLLERILIRKGRKAKLTGQFLHFSISIFLKRPVKTVYLMMRCLLHELRNL